MSHEFEVREEIVLAATPDQVWDAIATGPGVDSWFIGRSEIEPGVGGTVHNDCAGFETESTITPWEPGKRLAMRSEPGPAGARPRDALYLFVHGYEDSVVTQVYGFAADADEGAVENALQSWLGQTFAAPDEATDREYTLTHTYDAPREDIFAAWTEPARLA